MITIKTLDITGAIGMHTVVATLRNRAGCETEPDGYFTYHELPNKGYGDRDNAAKTHSQYFLGDGDIDIIKNFLNPSTGCKSRYEHANRRIFFHKAIKELRAKFQLTAPITFWAFSGARDLLIDIVSEPDWDFSNYGNVPATEFLESLNISGKATFSYKTLMVLYKHLTVVEQPLSSVIIPWIEQLPYADIFICNPDFLCGAAGCEVRQI